MQGRWEINRRATDVTGEPFNRDFIIGHLMSAMNTSEERAEKVVEGLERDFAENPNSTIIGPQGVAIVPVRGRVDTLAEIEERVNRFMWG